MTTFFLILGYLFAGLIIIAVICVLYMHIIDEVHNIYRNRRSIVIDEFRKEVVTELQTAASWLNGPDRKDFREFLKYLSDNVRRSELRNYDEIRQKVDQIIQNKKTNGAV